MLDDQSQQTRQVIDRFYEAYISGNQQGILDLLAEDAEVTFNGHGTFRGLKEIQAYMTWAAAQLPTLSFTVTAKIIEGDRAAVTWDETGVTAHGEPWTAIGVDVYRVRGGKVAELTVYTDTDKVARLLDPWPDSE